MIWIALAVFLVIMFAIGAWPTWLGHALATALGGVRDAFGWSAGKLADAGAPAIAKANAWIQRQPPIDWRKLAGALLNPRFWAFVLVCIAVLALARCADGHGPFAPSGREVAAEARTDVAEAEAKTRRASVTQRERVVARIERREQSLDAIEQQAEQARDAIQTASTFDARIALHGSFSERMRIDAARARAAAVLDYRTTIDP
jgi:hypothetical protein